MTPEQLTELKRLEAANAEIERLRERMSVMDRDIAEWVQLAKYQRKSIKNPNSFPHSPALAAIKKSESIIGREVSVWFQ